MRMWMIEPKLMCNKHLVAEHVELHMFVGAINRGRKLQGYWDNGLIDPTGICARHFVITHEMERRGLRHSSPLENDQIDFKKLVRAIHPGRSWNNPNINIELNKKNLAGRCKDCAARINSHE